MEKPMTTGQVAKKLFVHMRTVLNWINEGRIKAYSTPGNHRRITREEFNKFCKKYNMVVSE
jgi:excisionase family DNA binding protein